MHVRHRLPEQCQALGGKLGGYLGDAGDVAARPGKAGDETIGDRIAGLHRHHRQSRVLLGGERRRITHAYDQCDLAGYEVVDQLRQAVEVPMRGAPHEFEVLAENEPLPGKAANEPGTERALVGQVARNREHPNAIRLRRGLGASCSCADDDQEGQRGKYPE